MSSIQLDDLKQLFRKIIIPFHQIERDMTLPIPNHRPDTDAEHSWSLAVMAVSLAPEIDPSLDVGKIAIFATVHDIPEIYAGDTSVWADPEELATKKEREAKARAQLKNELPQFTHLSQYLDEYETLASKEAQFVYALDKFIGLLTIIEDEGYFYKVKNNITQEQYLNQLALHRTKAHTHPQVGAYYDEMRAAFDHNPQNFYAA